MVCEVYGDGGNTPTLATSHPLSVNNVWTTQLEPNQTLWAGCPLF